MGPDKASILDGFARAIAAAHEHVGATAPNPPVGCAILARDGALLAVGAHARAGGPHAEVVALERARAAGRIAAAHTMVVTLEPCNRTGRTPPCTLAILASPIQAVWAGALDPDLAAPGAGLAALVRAGRNAALLPTADDGPAAVRAECEALIRGFASRVRTGRPWVIVKQALDPAGSMIPPPGRTTFTAPASLRLAHELRRGADAIVTGSGTILADRPLFTVRRVPDHADAPPRRLLILDRRRRVPAGYVAAAEARGLRVSILDDPGAALDLAGREGALTALVEAGPRLTAAIAARGLWDEWLTIRKRGWAGEGDDVTRAFRRP